MCEKACDSPCALRNHESTHFDERNELCTICGKAFKNIKNLRRHLLETHKVHLKFNCDVCQKKYKSQKELDVHTKENHSKTNS